MDKKINKVMEKLRDELEEVFSGYVLVASLKTDEPKTLKIFWNGHLPGETERDVCLQSRELLALALEDITRKLTRKIE